MEAYRGKLPIADYSFITKVVVMERPQPSPDEKYQKFLRELRAYSCGYWKWRKNFRIGEVFLVDDVRNPQIGTILKRPIQKKTQDCIVLENCGSFDLRTGRSLSGEQRYIFPSDDQGVQSAWELQSLGRRIGAALSGPSLSIVEIYADLLNPEWCKVRQVLDRYRGGAPERLSDRSAYSLSERELEAMSSRLKFAKWRILGHLPSAPAELSALAEMMEGDASAHV